MNFPPGLVNEMEMGICWTNLAGDAQHTAHTDHLHHQLFYYIFFAPFHIDTSAFELNVSFPRPVAYQ